MRYTIGIILFLFCIIQVQAQKTGRVVINGHVLPYMIDKNGDTLILARLDDITVSSPRDFKDREEYNKYKRYRRYAAKVYPYAVEAIRIFQEVEAETGKLKKKRHRKKFIREKQKELKEEFEEPLRKLTKTQGKVLIKMIERELDTPLYALIKDLRSGFTASYWNTVGKLYGHNLKDGYIIGEDPILDAVLNDMDISYRRPSSGIKSKSN